MPAHEFEGKTALITGGGAGIGRSIAIEWASRGGYAVVTDRDGSLASEVVKTIMKAGGRGLATTLDVANCEEIQEGVRVASRAAAGLDALFNVAGTNHPRNVEEIDDEDWLRMLNVNLTSIYRASKFAIPEMRKRGGGAIVNIASIAGVMGQNRSSAYSAAKGGVVNLTRNMAMDFARDNIRVNAVCPGSTRTPRTEGYWRNSPTGKSEQAELCPLKRSAEPEEVALPAIFLASAGASYMTGAIVVVDGGMTAGFQVPTLDRL